MRSQPCVAQVSIVEKADSSSVLPCPVSISTKNKMNFLFANLKDRDFLVQRISDFLQRTPDSSDAGALALTGQSVRRSLKVHVAIVCVRRRNARLLVLSMNNPPTEASGSSCC